MKTNVTGLKDYTAILRDLEKRKEEGQLKSTDAYKSMEFIANENGFKCERHQVVTEDGYILNVWRIPGKLQHDEQPRDKNSTQLPILLQHGLEASMMQWVFNRPEVAQAFVLARAGYDVWMGNNRGNRYSQTHVNLDPKSKEYWDFSWEEMGTKDTPAVIDYILNTTGAPKINYVGHSEGTTQIMAGAALMPKFYKEKFNLCIFLAPPASMMHNSQIGLHALTKYGLKAVVDAVELVGAYDLLPWNYASSGAGVIACKLLDGKLCDFIMSLFADEDPSIDYTERYDMYMSNEPAGAGYKDFVHYGQLIPLKTETFRRYDMGSANANIKKYGQKTPPDYDLKLLDFPLAIFSGSKDMLADPEDVAWLSKQVAGTTIFNHQYYLGHMSFAIAKDMSWWTVDAMAILNHYNGICDKTTQGSRFEIGNQKCMEQIGLM